MKAPILGLPDQLDMIVRECVLQLFYLHTYTSKLAFCNIDIRLSGILSF